MAQSRGRQNSSQDSRKKGGKRPEQKAGTARLWLTDVDVPGWFDNARDREDCLDVFYPKADSLPSPVYETILPGEFYCTYYAHQHPELKEEAVAARMATRLCDSDSIIGKKAGGESVRADVEKLMVKELKIMADKGCVTAACCLGYLYMRGRLVRKNNAMADQYLRLAAAKNDPLACFWLATRGGEEGLKYLNKSYELGFPSAVFSRAARICTGEVTAPDSELKMLAAYLAALANHGSMKSLYNLLHLLELPCGAKLRSVYAPAMLALLEGLAAENYAPAVLLKAEMVSCEVLYGKNVEEAGRLYLKARSLGAEVAAGEYAVYMLARAGDGSLTPEEKKKKVMAARTLLEEEFSQGRSDPETSGLLGSILVMSDDDADFNRGIQFLEDSLSGMHPDMALRPVRNILEWSGRPERHKAALRLLNSMVRKKNAQAIYLRGRYYLDGGLAGRKDTAKGLVMLSDAAIDGVWEASYLLAEIYLFGLYNCKPDNELAAVSAKLGASREGGLPCRVLYSLMMIGEIPGYPASGDWRNAGEAVRMIASNVAVENYLLCVVTMARLNTGNPLGKLGQMAGMSAGHVSQEDVIENAVLLVLQCKEHMRFARLGALCFLAHTLGKIGKTQYAWLFARVFAQELSLKQGVSCDDIADYLRKFVASAPQSYINYRLACGSDADKNRPLY